jgi:hypothetical protein
MSKFLTPQWLDPLRAAIKGHPRLSSTVVHSFHIANTLRHSLELTTSLLQASFKSKLPMRDLRLTFEWPTRSSSQALHWRSLCVRYSWGFILLYGLGCPGVTKVVVDPKKFVLPSPLWGFVKYPDPKIEAYNTLMYQSLDQSLAQYIIQVVHSHTHRIIWIQGVLTG